jgi:signal transduction histidine kinase
MPASIGGLHLSPGVSYLRTTGPVGAGGYGGRVPPYSARTRSIMFDALVSVAIAGLGILSERGVAETVIVALSMGIALMFRRHRPLLAMAAVALTALTQLVITWRQEGDAVPLDLVLAVLIAMYSVVKYAAVMRDAYIAAGVVAVGAGFQTWRDSDSWWTPLVFSVPTAAGVWLAGYVVRTRREYVVGLEERAATLEREREHLAQIAVAHERASIAREMHDVVAHSLAVIIVQADGGRYAMAADPEAGRATLATVADTARDALDEMRRLIDLLRSGPSDAAPMPDDGDRQVAGLSRIPALVNRARSAGVDVTLNLDEVTVPDGSTVSLAIYRLVQEALTNVLRHAGPGSRCTVTVACAADAVRVSIVDDGGTGAKASQSDRIGHGLVGMRERVAVLGGTLAVGPGPRGWSVQATLPLALAAVA